MMFHLYGMFVMFIFLMGIYAWVKMLDCFFRALTPPDNKEREDG